MTCNNGEGSAFAGDGRQGSRGRAIELIEGVQPLVVELNKTTPVIVVGPAFGDDLDLGAGVTPLFGIK